MLGLALLGLAGKLIQSVATSPLLGIPGLVLVVIGVGAAVFLVARGRRLKARTLADLLALTPGQFEAATAGMLRQLGYNDVRRTGGAGDLNVDVWARDPNGARVAIQCKQYGPGHYVGSPEVQTFIGMMYQHHGADRGIFVTTSWFSRPAVALAKQHNIVLWDGQELSRQLAEIQAGASSGTNSMNRHARVAAVAGLPIGVLLLAAAWVHSDQVTAATATVPARSVPARLLTPAAAPSPLAITTSAFKSNGQASR